MLKFDLLLFNLINKVQNGVCVCVCVCTLTFIMVLVGFSNLIQKSNCNPNDETSFGQVLVILPFKYVRLPAGIKIKNCLYYSVSELSNSTFQNYEKLCDPEIWWDLQ